MSEPAPGFQKHPGHQVEIAAAAGRVRILAGGTVIADTRTPLLVTESRHQPVWYVPLSDVNDEYLRGSEHITYCPFKGHASYWHIETPGGMLENALWGYRSPFTECLPLAGHVAFYADRVTVLVEGDDPGEGG